MELLVRGTMICFNTRMLGPGRGAGHGGGWNARLCVRARDVYPPFIVTDTDVFGLPFFAGRRRKSRRRDNSRTAGHAIYRVA